MTPPEFSVLLLAWDDADPSVAVLGGAALPPTLPLVYHLATQQPVLAVYPHLPHEEESVDNEPAHIAAIEPGIAPIASPQITAATATEATEETAAPTATEKAKDALDTEVALPGVQLLPSLAVEPGKAQVAGRVLFSRIIGLNDLTPAPALPAPAEQLGAVAMAGATAATSRLAAPVRSQWPTGTVLPGHNWQAPAAPYLGAGSVESFPPPPPAPPRPAATQPGIEVATSQADIQQPATEETADAEVSAEKASTVPHVISFSKVALQPKERPLAGDLNFDSDPELPVVIQALAFDEPTEEVGAAEAHDLSAPEDDLILDVPVVPVATRATAPTAAPNLAVPVVEPAAPVVLMPKLDGLNFRMIQYARQAAQLVRGRSDFAIIYAPNWPAWLAALELRDSTRKPLVLYVASLAADFAAPAERGWLLEIERMTLRRATLILVPDQAAEKQLRKHYADTIEAGRVAIAADEDAVQQHLSELALTSV